MNLLSIVDINDTYETYDVLKKKIIGKQDVDIADLISKLGISDWVQQGHKHSENSDGLCPFCQQSLPNDFAENLKEYFNDSYTSQLDEIKFISRQYKEFQRQLLVKCCRTSPMSLFFGKPSISLSDVSKEKSRHL